MGAEIIMEGSERNRKEEEINDEVLDLVRHNFKPEFLNRIDQIIIFKKLGEKELEEIVGIQIERLKNSLKDQGVVISVTDKAKKLLAKKGFDPIFGARPLKRIIQNELLNQVAMILLDKEEHEVVGMVVDEDRGKLAVRLMD
jgi:ATP-dependent Clp protease ATP-binding subunit ClpB